MDAQLSIKYYSKHKIHKWRFSYLCTNKAYVERYNRTVRHEWLEMNAFNSIEEAQETATKWLWTYNNERPNMAIGGITPAMKVKNLQQSWRFECGPLEAVDATLV